MDIARIKKAASLVSEGMDMFRGGPLSYYLENLAAAYDAVTTQYAPFKVGERVKLASTPDINEKDSWGWLGAKHYLVKGSGGTVKEVSYGTKGFQFYVSFDDESWIDSRTGEVNPTPHQHTYHFKEEWLRAERDSF